MIPLKLKLHNFCSIAEMELDLSALSLVGISAPNGTGKSSVFTYAPLFALFGKPRPGTGIDDMVRTGQQDMSVTFDFEHNGEVYQVIRTRKLGKKSTCELQKQTPTGWESLTGSTVRETDAIIENLLGIDYNTFVASSLILQGDASNFTKKLPGERKQVLSQILGLEIYDKLQALAKDHAKAFELKLEASKQELANLEEKLKSLPEVEAKLAEVKKSLTLTACDIRQKETELADVQVQIKDLEAKQQEAERIEKQIETLSQEIRARENEIKALNLKIIDAETILKSDPEILKKIAELEEIKAQIPALQAKEDRLKQLKGDYSRLDTELDKVINERNAVVRKVAKIETELTFRDELKQSAEQYQQGLKDLQEMDKDAEQWQLIQDDILQVEKYDEQLNSKLNQLLTEKKNYETKSKLLETANCPVSGEVNCVFLKDATEALKQIPIVESNISDTVKLVTAQLDIIKDLVGKQEELQYDKARHANCKKYVESLRQKDEQYASLSSKEELLQNLNEQKDGLSRRIEAISQQITDRKKEFMTLEAETESLPILKAKIPSLEVYVKQRDKLPEAKAVIQASREQIAKLDAEVTAKEEQISNLKVEKLDDFHIPFIGGIRQGWDAIIGIVKSDGKKAQEAIKDLQQSQNRLFASQGALTNQLDTLTLDKQKHDSLGQELAPLAKELVRWQTLVKAFSKNGIPALVIENAIPELERISNDILGEMSGGANTLQFITQRDAKSKDSTIETLDILVSDWAGTRPFESYSGGEQTRISLAIRFALSELLANRAGSKIEFIVGDEVLSDQSPEFRDMTVEAIKSLSNRFKKILIISHIPEIQTAFDQRIVLSEGGRVDIQFN